MADPMKIRANVTGDSTEVKVLVAHEMETGQRKDAQGKTIPAWFIQNFKVTHNDKVVLNAQSARRVQVQRRYKGRQGEDHVGRQPQRHAHRRSDDRVMAIRRPAVALALVASAIGVAFAQSSTVDEIAKYREALQDGNPAELWEARGEAMWKEPRGPKRVSFERCDLGVGAGVVKGAYAQLPRYFADAKAVMDLESRLVYCMVSQQGISEADARRRLAPNLG